MAERLYNQYCPVARALEVVGGRWTMLIVRELFSGPKRYTDLMDRLPGVGTNMLAARLKELEDDKVIKKSKLPPPAASTVYELTELGHILDPVITHLARFGLHFLDPARPRDQYRPSWVVLGLQASFRPSEAMALEESYEFRVDGEIFHVTVEYGTMRASLGPAYKPDLVINANRREMALLAAGREIPNRSFETGKIKIEGKQESLDNCHRIFGLPGSSKVDNTAKAA
jgi:DNA-binding HxlR family transcriptional regulator